jgi:hypothetical protein
MLPNNFCINKLLDTGTQNLLLRKMLKTNFFPGNWSHPFAAGPGNHFIGTAFRYATAVSVLNPDPH